MPIVAMPDGTQVQFPDEMPPDQIRSLIVQKFPDAAKPEPVEEYNRRKMLELTKPSRDYLSETASNVPESAKNFAVNIAQPFLHPIDTAEGVYNIGKGILQKFGIASGTESEKYADAVGQFFKDRYGSTENIAKTLKDDPVGTLADLSAVLTGGGTLAAKVPGTIGRIGEATAATGRAVDPLSVVAAAARGAGHIAAEAVGMPTGVGGKALKEAAAAGAAGGTKAKDFLEAIGGTASRDPVADATAALANMRAERGSAYREAMAKLSREDATLGIENRILDFGKIDQAVKEVAGIKNFKGQDISPKTADIRAEMVKAIEDWKKLPAAEFHTIEGMDALKQKLGDIRDAAEAGKPSRVVANAIYNSVRKTIIDQAPEYAKIMKGYEEASGIIKEIEKTLSLSPNANVDTSLRKLQAVLRNNVNANYGRRAELADYLVASGARNLLTKLAGQSLNTWTPRGLGPVFSGLVNLDLPGLAKLAVLPASSPKAAGYTAFGLGALSRVAKPAAATSFQLGRTPLE